LGSDTPKLSFHYAAAAAWISRRDKSTGRGSTVVLAVIVVPLHPYSSALTIFSTRIDWLLCNSDVDATKRGPWCVVVRFYFQRVIRGFKEPKKQKEQRTDDQ
jgi:hypothetical protein